MKKYAVIAVNSFGEWMGLVDMSSSCEEFVMWKNGCYSPIFYGQQWLQHRTGKSTFKSLGYKRTKEAMRLHWDYIPGVFFSSISNSEKAENYWVYGHTENLYAYRLAKHLLAMKQKYLPPGFEGRVYRTESKRFKDIVLRRRVTARR